MSAMLTKDGYATRENEEKNIAKKHAMGQF
jgi:hypothetical protein